MPAATSTTHPHSGPKFSKLLSTSTGGTSIKADVPGTDTVNMGRVGYLAFYPKPERDKCSDTISYYPDDKAYSDRGSNISGSAYITPVLVTLKK